MSAEEEKTDAKKETKRAEAGGDEDAPQEEESTATFEPVVRLEEVQVVSGEENDEVVLQERGKLYVHGETMLDKGTGNKTWKERGVGDMRILRNKDTRKLRILMRQEKTLKIIANHSLDPRLELKSNAGSDRSWVWTAPDYSEENVVDTTFAIKFGNSDVADSFKKTFVACQKEMESILSGKDKNDNEGAVEEAADALAALSTKDETKEE